jgi:hypothetical protein
LTPKGSGVEPELCQYIKKNQDVNILRNYNGKDAIQGQGPNASDNGGSPTLLQYNENPANDNILHTSKNKKSNFVDLW